MSNNRKSIILTVVFIMFPLGEVFAHGDKIDSLSSPVVTNNNTYTLGRTL